jgi:hypothetical protein
LQISICDASGETIPDPEKVPLSVRVAYEMDWWGKSSAPEPLSPEEITALKANPKFKRSCAQLFAPFSTAIALVPQVKDKIKGKFYV